MHAGDSWHCPDHQTDVCQGCGGLIYRNMLPRTWPTKAYVEERKRYVPALTITPDDDEFDPASAKGKREREIIQPLSGYPKKLDMVRKPQVNHVALRGAERALLIVALIDGREGAGRTA